MSSRVQFGVALLLDVIGAAVALLAATRPWQSILFRRPRPLADEVLRVSGRTISAAPTALGLVALAGIVAVLATRGPARRLVGVVLAVSGLGLTWFSLAGMHRVSASRAAALFQSKHQIGVDVSLGAQVGVRAGWAVLSAIAGVLVLTGGALVAARGHRWVAMSARYEAPPAADSSADRGPDDPSDTPARADGMLWSALDRGDDPTARDER